MVTSTDELQGAVGTAKTAVAELLAEDRALGEIAFRRSCNSRRAERADAAAASAARGADTHGDIDDTYATPESSEAAIARYLHIKPDAVADLFDERTRSVASHEQQAT